VTVRLDDATRRVNMKWTVGQRVGATVRNEGRQQDDACEPETERRWGPRSRWDEMDESERPPVREKKGFIDTLADDGSSAGCSSS
jgi:hypothetical protein